MVSRTHRDVAEEMAYVMQLDRKLERLMPGFLGAGAGSPCGFR